MELLTVLAFPFVCAGRFLCIVRLENFITHQSLRGSHRSEQQTTPYNAGKPFFDSHRSRQTGAHSR